LAKYAGVAACYPPSRPTIYKLFDASDHNQSGYIEEIEFRNIMIIACTQITSRIMTYYMIIILSVPYMTQILIRTLLNMYQYMGVQHSDVHWLESVLTYGKIVETTLSFMIFFIAVPYIFDFIDAYSRQQASSTTTITTKSATTSSSS
jgi:large-conductance mechanosensitive channel